MTELDLHWTAEDPDLGIPSEGVCCKDISEIIERIREVKDTVKKINLNNQLSLTEVPAVLGECTQLEELNISHTKLTEIPEYIFTLPNLRVLSCCCNALFQFPKNIFKAEKLEKLHIRINKEWAFPAEVCSLQNLKILTADLYSHSALPENMGSLQNLEELTLVTKYDEGDVPSLPESFRRHDALKKLTINDPFYRKRKNFDLASAAQTLSSCNEIEFIKLSGVAVGYGHQHLSSLTRLKELELRHLLVEGNIFDSISCLHNLEKLDIWGSEFRITEIPDIFGSMKQLRSFSFAGNIVLELPPSIYELDNLVSLEIGSTGISVIDEKIINLKNLTNLQLYDNILEKLPNSVFSLPRLKILNIEENIFNSGSIAAIREKLKALAAKGQRIQFLFEGQGHRQMVKKLRALKNIEKMDTPVYARYCQNAVFENPYAIKYIDKLKLHNTKFYQDICIAAVKKTCSAMENIDIDTLGKSSYFSVCMEAAGSHDIGNAFNLIKKELLADNEYIQVCVKAALHNKSPIFLDNFNSEYFNKHFSREIYERLCWIAVLHYPPVISKMENPTKELYDIAVEYTKKHG
jgi:Leucine-rich repeat (LRR) protein